MVRRPHLQPLVPSVLDRLLVERRGRRALRDLKEFVAEDLEDLLNTRCRCGVLPADLVELKSSLVNYGLPDFTGVKMSATAEQMRLRRLLEDTIRRYESRLFSVHVTAVGNKGTLDRTLHFEIEATLNVEPAPQQVMFDSSLEPASAVFTVK
jgi:type VI secretion system protein ImpF